MEKIGRTFACFFRFSSQDPENVRETPSNMVNPFKFRVRGGRQGTQGQGVCRWGLPRLMAIFMFKINSFDQESQWTLEKTCKYVKMRL
jgi:hypothetical protein